MSGLIITFIFVIIMKRGVHVNTTLKTESKAYKQIDVRQSYFTRLKKNYKKYKWVYYMAIPVFLYYVIFKYIPMFGIVIAFQDFRPAKGIFNSKWVGLAQFIKFFKSPFALRVIRNTFMLNFYSLLWGFPAPIILALLLNEVRHMRYKKVIQTISYLPHFVSSCRYLRIIKEFSLSNGLFNDILSLFGFEENIFLQMLIYLELFMLEAVFGRE